MPKTSKHEVHAIKTLRAFGYHCVHSAASKIPDIVACPISASTRTVPFGDPRNPNRYVLIVECCSRSSRAKHRRDLANCSLETVHTQVELWSYLKVDGRWTYEREALKSRASTGH